jgi:hypothetical protein
MLSWSDFQFKLTFLYRQVFPHLKFSVAAMCQVQNVIDRCNVATSRRQRAAIRGEPRSARSKKLGLPSKCVIGEAAHNEKLLNNNKK